MRFRAALAGVDLSKETPKEAGENPQFSKSEQVQSIPMFGDPKDYEKMTPEQRQAKTDQMMSKHRSQFGDGKIGG